MANGTITDESVQKKVDLIFKKCEEAFNCGDLKLLNQELNSIGIIDGYNNLERSGSDITLLEFIISLKKSGDVTSLESSSDEKGDKIKQEIIKLLISRGLDINELSGLQKETALDIATRCHSCSMCTFFKNLGGIKRCDIEFFSNIENILLAQDSQYEKSNKIRNLIKQTENFHLMQDGHDNNILHFLLARNVDLSTILGFIFLTLKPKDLSNAIVNSINRQGKTALDLINHLIITEQEIINKVMIQGMLKTNGAITAEELLHNIFDEAQKNKKLDEILSVQNLHLVNDDNGNTILHLIAQNISVFESENIDLQSKILCDKISDYNYSVLNQINNDGQTAFDIANQFTMEESDAENLKKINFFIQNLQDSGAIIASELLKFYFFQDSQRKDIELGLGVANICLVVDNVGNTVLHLTAEKIHLFQSKEVYLMIKKLENQYNNFTQLINKINNEGHTALDIAKQIAKDEMLENNDIVQALKKHKAKTAFELLEERINARDIEAFKELLKNVDVRYINDIKNEDGQNLCHLVVIQSNGESDENQNKYIEILQFLIEDKKINYNLIDITGKKSGKNPLDYAKEGSAVFDYLKELGASVSQKKTKGNRANLYSYSNISNQKSPEEKSTKSPTTPISNLQSPTISSNADEQMAI